MINVFAYQNKVYFCFIKFNNTMNNPKITKIIKRYLAANNKKWYLEIDNNYEVEVPEKQAKELIKLYDFEEYNLRKWQPKTNS